MSSAVQTAVEVRSGPPSKRQKLSAAQPPRKSSRTSKFFAPYRTIGLVTPTDVPFVSQPLGKTTFQITTSVGKSLQTYDLKRGLNLVFVTRPQTPGNITATATWNERVLAAWHEDASSSSAGGIWVFKRGKKIDELGLPNGRFEEIRKLVVFGSWIVGCGRNKIEIWRSSTLEHYTTLYPRRTGSDVAFTGTVSCMPTFLNKIFVGRMDGSVEIWNVSTGKLLYSIQPSSPDLGSVTALEPTPSLSLLAIAYSSGPVVIHNIQRDTEILRVNSSGDSIPAVTSISFRTDGLGAGEDGRKDGVMATASVQEGDVTFWDLNQGGRKMGLLRGAHSPPSSTGAVSGGISRVEFLPGQAVVITSGLDNALKSWVFDESPVSPVPRILHARSGHHAPISSMQFLPAEADNAEAAGKWLITGSHDRSLWGWSLRRDGQSTELSQGAIRKKAKKAGILGGGLESGRRRETLEDLKAPPISAIACSLNRDGGMGAMPGSRDIWTLPNKSKNKTVYDATVSGSTGWESIVTAHAGDKFARTWFWGRKRAGRWMFGSGDGGEVTSVAVSACGTFALVGSSKGGIDMYNLQSGMHRRKFPPPVKQGKTKRSNTMSSLTDAHDKVLDFEKQIHHGPVTGIQIDTLNHTVFSCAEDGKIKFWDFHTGKLRDELDWSMTSIRGMKYHRPSDLVALSCSDSCIRVVDVETRKLVRELYGGIGHALDFTFSDDGRWVLSVSADGVLRVWDLSTGHLIEAMRFSGKPTALAFSMNGEYLATAHENSVGVQLWSNRTLFTHVAARQIAADDIADMAAPTVSGEGTVGLLEATFASEQVEEDTDDTLSPNIEQLSSKLLTLSLVPKPRWQTLLHLDLIRQRNKPKEPPKPPEKAPFFLPSLENGSTTSVQQAANDAAAAASQAQQAATGSRISTIADPAVVHTNTFTTLLRAGNSIALVAHLATLPPSSADLAIRTIDSSPPYDEMLSFIRALTARLRARRDFELIQTWMCIFLKCHSDVLLESEEIREGVRKWKGECAKVEQGFGETVGFCRGVSAWVGGVV